MASVEDIRLRENYLNWDQKNDHILIVKPEKRDWTRTNYEMDIRYIEWMFDHKPGDINQPIDVHAYMQHMGLWNLKWRFLRKLVEQLSKRIKNKVTRIIIIHSTLSVWFAHWWYTDLIPFNVRKKIIWK